MDVKHTERCPQSHNGHQCENQQGHAGPCGRLVGTPEGARWAGLDGKAVEAVKKVKFRELF